MKGMHLVLFLLTALIGHSQKKAGLVHYGEIQSMGMGGPVGSDMNAILVFGNWESLYITAQDSLEGGHISEQRSYRTVSGGGFSKTVSTNEPGFQYYNDLKENRFYSRDIGFNYISEPTPQIPWQLTHETKKIGKHLVYKATAHFRGRDYTAWFTTDVPLPYGPWKLQGLPGLILEAYDSHQEIYWYFKALEYPTSQGHLLKPIHNKDDWSTLQAHRNRTLKALKESRLGGRMETGNVSFSVEIDSQLNILRFFIENFIDDSDGT